MDFTLNDCTKLLAAIRQLENNIRKWFPGEEYPVEILRPKFTHKRKRTPIIKYFFIEDRISKLFFELYHIHNALEDLEKEYRFRESCKQVSEALGIKNSIALENIIIRIAEGKSYFH